VHAHSVFSVVFLRLAAYSDIDCLRLSLYIANNSLTVTLIFLVKYRLTRVIYSRSSVSDFFTRRIVEHSAACYCRNFKHFKRRFEAYYLTVLLSRIVFCAN